MHAARLLAMQAIAVLAAVGSPALAQSGGAGAMTFFVTSANPGRGAELGGLAGADAYCATLAQAAGAPASRSWRAYLSTQAAGGAAAVNARDRIGPGPWRNVAGTVIAETLAQLHGDNALTADTALTEKGGRVSLRESGRNDHDILTGTQPDGTAFPPGEDRTCRNWTSGAEGSAFVGHVDRRGLDESAAAKSWNSSHATRGCGLDTLRLTGGAGLLYCFAAQ